MGKSTQILAHMMTLVPRLVKAHMERMELPRGDVGPQGDRGARGQKGDRGAMVTNAAIVNDQLCLTVDEHDILVPGIVVGVQGEPGPVGARGITGEPGLQGEPGPVGAFGEPGEPGSVGAKGVTGEPGKRGKQGVQGIAGEPGSVGPVGARGIAGEPGLQGETGEPGIQGIAGDPGIQGEPGKTGRGIEKAYVSNGGTLVVAFTDGEQHEVGYVMGERGLRGSKGVNGVQGENGIPGRGVAWMGAYDPKREYHGQYDTSNPTTGQASLVKHDGSVYIALTATSGNTPSADSDYWDVFI